MKIAPYVGLNVISLNLKRKLLKLKRLSMVHLEENTLRLNEVIFPYHKRLGKSNYHLCHILYNEFFILEYTINSNYDMKLTTKGNKAFINFLSDKNKTLMDQGLRNALQSLLPPRDQNLDVLTPTSKYQNMIVVHLRFLQPKINIIDVKYTWSDLIAGFGGKFGIFAQITGWSFLGILNLLLAIIKLFFYSKK